MYNLIFVFLGGGLGSVFRYVISYFTVTESTSFPIATLITNILASFILGVLLGIQVKNNLQDHHALLLMTGFCGGFSTFSTFSAESLRLFQNQEVGLAILYIAASIVFGLLSVYIGFKTQSSI